LLIGSRDIDPVYPVLRAVYDDLDLPTNERHLFTLAYLATYNLASAYHLWADPTSTRKLPIGIERRGLRTEGAARRYVERAFTLMSGRGWDVERWITMDFTDDPYQNFRRFFYAAQLIDGNGRWAAFKWAELLKTVHDLPIAAPDLCLRECSGPKDGLRRLYGAPPDTDIAVLEGWAQELKWDAPWSWEELETVLCNFDSMAKGRYYVGHDIDEMQHVITEAAEHGTLDGDQAAHLWEARARALPEAYLGEVHGWYGVQRDRKTAYRDRGEIVVR